MTDSNSADDVKILSGDVAVEKTRLNTKGGSVTATLKKPLSAAFRDSGDTVTGARLGFSDRAAVVLLPESDDQSHFEVRKVGNDRFVIDLVRDNEARVDRLTASFLNIITEQFKKGQRPVLVGEDVTRELEDLLRRTTNLDK